MEMENDDGGIGRVYERLSAEGPLWKCDPCVYHATVCRYFQQIQAMRREGFSYVQICRAFEEEKVLPGNPKVNSFRQAYRRERVRRERGGILKSLLKGDGGELPRKPAVKPVIMPEPQVTTAKTPEEVEKERQKRRIGGTKVETLNGGTITKYTDGGFDFD